MAKMLTASSATLPRYMLAISPQANSGFWPMSSGPGVRPHSTNAASSTAVEAEPGMPSVSSGTMAPDEAALFAASGPTRPAIAPLPNFSGVRDTDFSMEYDMSEATVAPAPGSTPTTKPSSEPRASAQRVST